MSDCGEETAATAGSDECLMTEATTAASELTTVTPADCAAAANDGDDALSSNEQHAVAVVTGDVTSPPPARNKSQTSRRRHRPTDVSATTFLDISALSDQSLPTDLYNIFIRPPDTRVGGLIFYRDSSFFFFLFIFFATYPPSSLNGTQRKLVTCSEVSAIWKRMSKIWVSSPPTNSKNHFFDNFAT